MAEKSPTHSDILHIFGGIEDHKAMEIMDLDPSFEEIEVAREYLADMSDVMGEERHPLTGKSARIYEIIVRDEYLDEEEAGRR